MEIRAVNRRKAALPPFWPRVFVQVIYRIEFLIKLEYISCFAPLRLTGYGDGDHLLIYLESRGAPSSTPALSTAHIKWSRRQRSRLKNICCIFKEPRALRPLPFPARALPFANPRPPLAFPPLSLTFFLTWAGAETCETYFASFMSTSTSSSFYFFSFLFFFSPFTFFALFQFSHLALWLKLQMHSEKVKAKLEENLTWNFGENPTIKNNNWLKDKRLKTIMCLK